MWPSFVIGDIRKALARPRRIIASHHQDTVIYPIKSRCEIYLAIPRTTSPQVHHTVRIKWSKYTHVASDCAVFDPALYWHLEPWPVWGLTKWSRRGCKRGQGTGGRS